jgi:hypothetical protein
MQLNDVFLGKHLIWQPIPDNFPAFLKLTQTPVKYARQCDHDSIKTQTLGPYVNRQKPSTFFNTPIS